MSWGDADPVSFDEMSIKQCTKSNFMAGALMDEVNSFIII